MDEEEKTIFKDQFVKFWWIHVIYLLLFFSLFLISFLSAASSLQWLFFHDFFWDETMHFREAPDALNLILDQETVFSYNFSLKLLWGLN